MSSRQSVQFRHQLAVAATGQIGFHPVLEGVEAGLLQTTGLRSGERGIRYISQRRAPPKGQGLAKSPRRLYLVTAGGLFPGFRDEGPEVHGVHGGRVNQDEVTRRLGDHDPFATSLPQRLAQPGHVHPEGMGRPIRWVLAPQVIGQALRRHHPVRRQQQQRQERPFPTAPHRQAGTLVVDDLEGTENAELHWSNSPQ